MIEPDPTPPHARLVEMGIAYWVSRTVYAAAELGLADHLAAGPRSADELAEASGTHAPSLHRLMRTLAGLGLLTQSDGRRFALTALGEALRTDASGSARATVLTSGSAWFAKSFDHIVQSVRTGRPGAERALGMGFFEYLARHPDDASLFSEGMVGFNRAGPSAIAEAYDFSTFDRVVDVGGATGDLLAAILARHAGPRGVLFDRPHVVRDAPALLAAKGVAERVDIEAGDFFEAVPPGGDAYILSHIVHDWDEDRCLAILDRCRLAMRPDSRLLVAEMVLPEGDASHPGKMLDMVMLVLFGGQERTEAEYAALLDKAGFRLTRVVPTQSAISLLEAVRA